MEWHQINYFQTVAKTQHLTRAAELLKVSQPALSRAIAKLEAELGVQLFNRQGRNICLNRYGEMFLKRVEQAIKQIEIGQEELRHEINPDQGTIAFAFLPSHGMKLVPELVSAYRAEFPNVKFLLNQSWNQVVIDQLKVGKVDLALIALINNEPEIVCERLISEELFLIVSVDHPLADQEYVDLEHVADQPFISFKEHYGLRDIIYRIFNNMGCSPNIVFEAEDIGTVYGLVGANLGVSLVPDLPELNKSKVRLIRVRQPQCQREIGIAYLKEGYLSPLSQRFLDYVKSYFKKLEGKHSYGSK